ncbi:alkaline phosphatase D family protein [Echinicola marina]|uniref:alkaline phosphatase D family protein n=1 Tax=Echinicola marina TaxID=2859768 RepID=UPI001CF61AAA|nr:alkaline phosphatase D family protein [Echinicola marina]UCS95013.1 alkaline phosphatase D family protein [Echinicola marina]
MKRRYAVKAIALSSVVPHVLLGGAPLKKGKVIPVALVNNKSYESSWHLWPDMKWVGPDFWGNRLQDWEIRKGKATCVVQGNNRTLYTLSHELGDQEGGFELNVTMDWLAEKVSSSSDVYAGFRLGAKGKFDDYRSAAVFGKGLDVGVRGNGELFIGDSEGAESISLNQTLRLRLVAEPKAGLYHLKLTALSESGDTLAAHQVEGMASATVSGALALVSHFPGDSKQGSDQPSVAFSNWELKGAKVLQFEDREFGPICFAQYTLHDKTLKLNAQLAPIEAISGKKISLKVKTNGKWETLQESTVDPMGRVAQFRIENWEQADAVSYQVHLELSLLEQVKAYTYEGTIAKEPTDISQVKMAVFSCNADYGFPDGEVSEHVAKHQPDLAVFLGDQFYEGTGGFGIQTSPIEKASLDYLRKWYMFGWSYREIFRHIPSAFIPDDHDVYHGNVWGEGGKHAPSDEGWGYVAQDQGGYKMPPEWVNMVQKTQTGHLPDPYDPSPVKQGIGAYYTDWIYGGVSFAILEDRKFKTAPKNVLPEEAKVTNGFIQNRDFDIKKYYDIEAQLLGERQLEFLENWTVNWPNSVQMKAVLSQTNFCTVATLPEGSIIDSIVPKLPIPAPGEYVSGDAPTSDMDSNGWPQKGRDEALKIIRKSFALHIAGDQHLASVVHYGVDDFGDSGYAFAGPALNNLFPRRWWPQLSDDHQSLPGKSDNTGNFHDGFGNKMTIHAVANPSQTGRKPALIYDRATGYGIVTFDKSARTMKMECWPRYVDPEKNPDGQYEGWPVMVSQDDNYSRKAVGYLPLLKIEGKPDPVLKLVNEATGQTEYCLRIKGNSFRPKVFEKGKYTAIIQEEESGQSQVLAGLVLSNEEGAFRTVSFKV